ncbi:Chitin synthase, class 1 [Nowakowskiella sp. JEL0078]|nr:Chitin synthase, class 1 [Nowakowskiella sp. JEL0078]
MSGEKKKKAPPTDFGGAPPPMGATQQTQQQQFQPSEYSSMYTQQPPAPDNYTAFDANAFVSKVPPADYTPFQAPQTQYVPPQQQYAAPPQPQFVPPPQPQYSNPPQPQFATPPQPQYATPPQPQFVSPPQQQQYAQMQQLSNASPQLSYIQPTSTSSSGSTLASEAPRQRKNKGAAPDDYKELPLPSGFYRHSYKVEGLGVFPNEPQFNLRYTAATHNWDSFADQNPHDRGKYTLIQEELGYTTSLLVLVTMYNEDADLFVQTMGGVYECIEYLVEREAEAGLNAKNIVVAIICDGRSKCPKDVKMALELLGCYQSDEKIMTDFQDNPVQAHIFEHTSKNHVIFKDELRTDLRSEFSKVEVQYLLCMKEHNRKKIDSHGWAFKAFAPLLKPDVIVLFDMGTKPERKALYHLWMHFKDEPTLGGACGEIQVRVDGKNEWERTWKLLTDPLLASQNFEYKMSNILDKSLQSVFGYITVLPGAFSAYRYAAIKGKPLHEYFLREHTPAEDEEEKEVGTCASILTANKYLAEDRILCFEVFTKADEEWIMRYVKEATANTDAPDKLSIFLNQRRRWFNGSMFAFLSAFASMGAISRSDHTAKRKALFYIEMIYLMVDLIFSLLGPMFFYGVFISMWAEFWRKLGTSNKWDEDLINGINTSMTFIYSLFFFFGMLLFIGNKPQGSSIVYLTLSVFWGLMIIFVLVLIVMNGIRTFGEARDDPSLKSYWQALTYIFSLLMTYGLYIISSAVFRDIAHVFTSMPGYLVLLPTYINMMLVFALCNIHDVSWGTRAEDPESKDLPRNKMANGKVVLKDWSHEEGLTIDVDSLQRRLNTSDNKEKFTDREDRKKARKQKRASTQDDRNQTVRMILLLLFITLNMGGAMAVTYFGVVQMDETFKSIYGGIIFGAVFGFAAIKFFGCVYFVIKTPSHRMKL